MFFAGKRQTGWTNNPEVETMDVRSIGSTGDTGRKKAMLVRTKSDEDMEVKLWMELVQRLYKIHKGRAHLTLMTYRSYGKVRQHYACVRGW